MCLVASKGCWESKLDRVSSMAKAMANGAVCKWCLVVEHREGVEVGRREGCEVPRG
jgi:hypothetical protein